MLLSKFDPMYSQLQVIREGSAGINSPLGTLGEKEGDPPVFRRSRPSPRSEMSIEALEGVQKFSVERARISILISYMLGESYLT